MERLAELYLRILPSKFHYLKFILEGYDNLAILSAYNSLAGIVVVRYPASMATEVFSLLSAIAPSLTGINSYTKTEDK
jgi:hypothetical protein